MVFNSITFLVFFILFFHLYWFINNKYSVKVRNIFTILSSYVFYGWWDWRFLLLMIFSSVIDYFLANRIQKSFTQKQKKYFLGLSLFFNLGILGYFKYYNFFIESFAQLLSLFSLSVSVSTLNIILPVGISFYTFQTLSYTLDIYRGKMMPAKDIIQFFAFVSFFPQLVAGPIERAFNLLNQFEDRKQFSYENCIIGLRHILWGLFKKIVIADNFGILVDSIYSDTSPASGWLTIAGGLFFGFQVYADFSGYSDIAIGTAKMLDINLMKNFETPFFSASFTEFWRRWHISLSSWFRDYLYIPLGGNRRGEFRNFLNIFITFFISGLWHGAGLTYILFGSLHGIAVAVERKIKLNLPKYAKRVLFIMLLTIMWIPFRAKNTSQLYAFAQSLFKFSEYNLQDVLSVINDFSNIKFMVFIPVVFVFFFAESKFAGFNFAEWISAKNKIFRMLFYYFLFIAILLLGNFNLKPQFIYFQF